MKICQSPDELSKFPVDKKHTFTQAEFAGNITKPTCCHNSAVQAASIQLIVHLCI